MKVVLDTNILISAFVFPGGVPEFVYRAGIEKRIDLVTSPPLLAEFGRVLIEKFGWDSAMTERAVGQVARVANMVRPTTTVRVVEDDPSDDRVLEAAAMGEAEVIVSGDGHLTRIGEWEGIRILTAPGLLAELGIDANGH